MISINATFLLILPVMAIALLALVTILEYRKNKGSFNINSLAWIGLSLIIPIISPVIYLIAERD